MKIYDINNNLIENPDLSLGHLESEKRLITRHPAREAVPEQFHYEVIAEYPNGGKDIRKVVDIPAVEAQEAWDEYEDIYRYIPYTEEELIEMEEAAQNTTENLLLEMAADHEYRICLIELGVTKNDL